MRQNVSTFQPGRLTNAETVGTVKTLVTFSDATELRRLYGEFPNAAAAARQALKTAGEPLSGAALQRLREANATLVAIFERIKTILG